MTEVTAHMSIERRTTNPGKRERMARKRHRRTLFWWGGWPSGTAPLKLGSKHLTREFKKSLAVADAETPGEHSEECCA